MPTSPNSVDDLVDIVAGINKRLSKVEGMASGQNLPDPTSPILADISVTGLTGTATQYNDPVTQAPKAKVTWTWTDIHTTTNTDPAYDLPTKYQVSFTTPTLTVDHWKDVSSGSYAVDNLPLNTNVTLKVRAVAWSGRLSATASNTTNTSKDTTPPNQPSTPTVTPELKAIRVVFDGKDSGGTTLVADTNYVEVHVSTGGATFTPTTSTFVTRVAPQGCNIVLVQPNYVQYWVRLVAVDVSGNASAPSTAGTATPNKAINTDMGIALPGDIAFRDEGNLVIDGSFESALIQADRLANGSVLGNVTFDNTLALAAHGTWSVKFTGDGVSPKQMYLQNPGGQEYEIPVGNNVGAKLYAAVKIRGTGANGTATMDIRWQDASAGTTTTTVATTSTSTGSYVLFESVVVIPSNAVTANVRLYTTSHTTGTWNFDSVQLRNITGTSLIEDAAITNAKIALLAVDDARIASANVAKLTAGNISAGQYINAGDTSSSYAQLSDTGLYIYRAGSTDGVPNLATRLGTANNDIFSVFQADGTQIAGVSDTGVVTGTAASFDNDVNLRGSDLLGLYGDQKDTIMDYGAVSGRDLEANPIGLLEGYAMGVVSRAWWYQSDFTQNAINDGGFIHLFNVGVDTLPGRSYTLNIGAIDMTTTLSSNGFMQMSIKRTTDGTDPTSSSPTVGYQQVRVTQNGNQGFPAMQFRHDENVGADVRFGVFLYAVACTIAIPSTTANIISGYIVDEGPTSIQSGTKINAITQSGGTPATPPGTVKNYTKTYTSNGWATYRSINSPLRGSSSSVGDTNSKIYQGYSSSGSFNGDQRGLWTFPSITGDVGSGTITSIKAYIYFSHWWYNAGGTALLKVHGYSSGGWPTGSLPTLTTAKTVSGWPNPGGKWVTLPSSLYAGFKAGTYRGFGIGPAGSTSLTYYGFANATAYLQVAYTK